MLGMKMMWALVLLLFVNAVYALVTPQDGWDRVFVVWLFFCAFGMVYPAWRHERRQKDS